MSYAQTLSVPQQIETPSVSTSSEISASVSTFTFTDTPSTTFEATTSPPTFNNSEGAEFTVTDAKGQTIYISPPSSLQTTSSPINSSSRKTISPATIAGSVIGSLATVVLALLFILWRRRKHRSRVGSNADEEIDDPATSTVPNSNPILRSSAASARTVSISTINSLTSDLPRRLSQSSRNAYEEEIERLRQEVLSREHHIRYMHEQMELTHSSSPPPSYRSSRRSDVSDPFVSFSTLPPPLPTREIPR
ncbi:uncharacterized protein ARMOST_20585 [Armillaria ostoyae]|uniref:Uncharacterized protein n=1 Tax=Armillaria ostoyae TaxID=47428 RepID=A0A284S7R6_ARMOS|nr:uncharacterized protein ARMOST_20585 [Armillaria ostoyae]